MFTSEATLRLRDLLALPKFNVDRLFRAANIQYTYNGRGALYQLMHSLPADKGHVILVPAFHCAVVVESIVRAGYNVQFYNINDDLSVDYDDLYAKLSPDVAAIVVIHYFGFPADIRGILALRAKYNYYVVEDWAHSFLNGETAKLTGEVGDAAVFSFRKLLPTYAGGALRINTDGINCDMASSRMGLSRSIVILKRLAEEIVENSDDGIVARTFRYIEHKRVDRKKNQVGSTAVQSTWIDTSVISHDYLSNVKLPWFLKTILYLSDLRRVIAARQENYCVFDKHLEENTYIKKVLPDLPNRVCPWAYPLWVRNREKYDVQLRDLGIPVFTFGDVLHPLVCQGDAKLSSSVEALSKELLMLPIHQNLTPNVVRSFCEKINYFFQSLQEPNTSKTQVSSPLGRNVMIP
jgi:dTDP-4-amino-4,6-dideoxygalactose transaminase